MGKPARVLLAFAKTKLLAPGESQILSFDIPLSLLASYDDCGKTGFHSAWVLEAGEYRIFVGMDVRTVSLAGRFLLAENVLVTQCEEAMAPVKAFERLRPVPAGMDYKAGWEPVPLRTVSQEDKRIQNLPTCLPYIGDQGWKL